MSSSVPPTTAPYISAFVMPSLGADMEHGTLVVWNVKPGDVVKRGDVVAEVETEKGVFAMESTIAGTVKELLVTPGTRAKVGAPLAQFETTEARAPGPPQASPEPPPSPPPAASLSGAPPPSVPGAPTPVLGARHVSPAARKLAAERGIDITTISGSGPEGAVVLSDVERLITGTAAQAEAPPRVDAARGMRQAVAAAVSRSKREIPHYYLSNEVSMAKALSWVAAENEKRPIGERILPATLLLKSIATALRSYPDLNGVWAEGELQSRPEIHLGVAISLRGGGLISPAIHNADQLPLDALMRALSDLVRRARSGGLRSSEMTDATITVSSLGDEGVTSLFGVIYPPQVALVGVGSIAERPWVEHGAVSAQPVVSMTLSADHRATDGHYGSRFLREVARLLQSPETL